MNSRYSIHQQREIANVHFKHLRNDPDENHRRHAAGRVLSLGASVSDYRADRLEAYAIALGALCVAAAILAVVLL